MCVRVCVCVLCVCIVCVCVCVYCVCVYCVCTCSGVCVCVCVCVCVYVCVYMSNILQLYLDSGFESEWRTLVPIDQLVLSCGYHAEGADRAIVNGVDFLGMAYNFPYG